MRMGRDTITREERLENVRRTPVSKARLEEYNEKYNSIFGKCIRSEITQEQYRRELKHLDAEYYDIIMSV